MNNGPHNSTFTLRPRCAAALLWALAWCILASPLNAQQVEERSVLSLRQAPSLREGLGTYSVDRVDSEAANFGAKSNISTGEVVVPGWPDMLGTQAEIDAALGRLSAHKLYGVGVLPVPGFPEQLALGAQWNYDTPIRRALLGVTPLIPSSITGNAVWLDSDSAVLELGRRMVAALLAARRVELLIASHGRKTLEYRILERVIQTLPQEIPEIPAWENSSEDLLPKFAITPEAKAALRLGPAAAQTLEALRKNSDDQLTDDHRRWIAFLQEGYRYLEAELQKTIDGHGERPGLKLGYPLRMDEPTRWPSADYNLVYRFGLASLGTLEALRATRYDFASRADWLMNHVRREAIRDLLERMNAMALEGRDIKAYFAQNRELNPDDRLRGVGPVDDLTILFFAADEALQMVMLQDELGTTFINSGDAERRRQGLAMLEVSESVRSAITSMAGTVAYPEIDDLLNTIRSYPNDVAQQIERLQLRLAQRTAEDIAVLGVAGRIYRDASRMQAKFNWHFEQIRARDQRRATEAFVNASTDYALKHANGLELTVDDRSELSRNGRILVDEAWAKHHGIFDLNAFVVGHPSAAFPVFHPIPERPGVYEFFGDPAYHPLFRLSTELYERLIKDGAIQLAGGIRFTGEPRNDGRDYDHQFDLKNKGVSIDLRTPAEQRSTFAVVPGRTYVFSFDYLLDGLDGSETWVRFIMLNANGEVMEVQRFDHESATNEVETPRNYDPKEAAEYEGKFLPFVNLTRSENGDFTSPRFVGDTKGEFKQARFVLNGVPAGVMGFSVEVKVANLAGQGAVYYRNFRLELIEKFFNEGFEPISYRALKGENDPIANETHLLDSNTWKAVLEPETGHMPMYSGFSFNTLEKHSGQRALQIEPNGFNVRLVTNKFYALERNNSYVFRAALNTERMEGMRAWFEVMLYDERRNPVTVDGVPTTEGNNIMRTPARGENPRSVVWDKIQVSDRWFLEELVFDDLRKIDLRVDDKAAEIDRRDRREVHFARVAIVVHGQTPSHSARVLVDSLELREYPRVTISLQQRKEAPNTSLLDLVREDAQDTLLGRTLARAEAPKDGRRVRLFLSMDVEGLEPRRIGYHYTVELSDYLGNEVKAADTLGSQRLDKVVYSTDDGRIRGREFGYIFLDELKLANRYGYFSAKFTLRYKDEREPIVQRDFKIGFLPEPLEGERSTGELGIILDQNSHKHRWLHKSLEHLGVGRIGIPVVSRSMAADGGAYGTKEQQILEEWDYLMRLMPQVRASGILGHMPQAYESMYLMPGNDAIFSDTAGQQWKDLLAKVHTYWRERFDNYLVSHAEDTSFSTFGGHAARAMDNLNNEFIANRVDWAPRVMPVTLRNGMDQQEALTALIRIFADRWQPALDAQDQPTRDLMLQALTPEDVQRVRTAEPPRIWLRERETFSFFAPQSVSADDMEASVRDFLAAASRYENVLGDDPQAALANASALAAGQPADFSTTSLQAADVARHTLVIELKQVSAHHEVSFQEQLRDLTEKIVRAKTLGFNRIFLNRLRNTAGDDEPDGLLTRDNLAQPSFFAFRTLNAVVSHRDHDPLLQLKLAKPARYHFFRSPADGSLSFFLFPGAEDSIERLPFGNNVRRVDLMGNVTPLEPLPDNNGLGSGMVELELQAGGLPIILTGIDTQLLNSTMSITLDQNTLDARVVDQQRGISFTNRFDERITLALRIPLRGGSDDDTIARQAVFKTTQGNEVGAISGEFRFETVELQPGETRTFPFVLRPLISMQAGERVLPVQMLIKGRQNYLATHRLPIQIQPLVAVTGVSALEAADGTSLDVVLTATNTLPAANALTASVVLTDFDGVRPRTRDFSLAANETRDISVRLPSIPRARLEGLRLRISLRQSPGTLFYNDSYRITIDEVTSRLVVLPEAEYLARQQAR